MSLPGMDASLPGMDASAFAGEWIAARITHDLARNLNHFAEGVGFRSPNVVRALGRSEEPVRGREDLRACFTVGLAICPDSHFGLVDGFEGVDCLVIGYPAIEGRIGLECFEFDPDRKAVRDRACCSVAGEVTR